MKISVEQFDLETPVTMLKLEGALDGSCYLEVIEKAKSLYQAGTRDLLLDFSLVSFLSSAGIVALHNVALIMRGERPLDTEDGWGALRAIGNELEQSDKFEAHCKLLNPQPRTVKSLTVTGFDKILAMYTDQNEALASFGST